MKKEIHPEYMEARVVCSCGNIIQTRATKPELHIEICSSCHPFFTGKQKFVDAAGRVERFEKRYKKYQQKNSVAKHKKKESPVPIQAESQAKQSEIKPVQKTETKQVKEVEIKQAKSAEAKAVQSEPIQVKEPGAKPAEKLKAKVDKAAKPAKADKVEQPKAEAE